jgi:hypothetical protein
VKHDPHSSQAYRNVLNAGDAKQGGPAVSKLASAYENKMEREIKKEKKKE